jgi:hypothetical protein
MLIASGGKEEESEITLALRLFFFTGFVLRACIGGSPLYPDCPVPDVTVE